MKKYMAALLLSTCIFGFSSQAAAQKSVPILMYHSIDEFKGSGIRDLYVSPKSFEQQMKYLKDNGYTLLTFERWDEVNKVKKPIFVTFDDGYKNLWNAFSVFQKLKDDTFQPVGTIFAISDFLTKPKRLSGPELLEMSNSKLFSIQSHTATHPDLRSTPNSEYELKESKEKLESITGKPVIALAYPFGFFDDRVIAETKNYYKFAVTVKPGLFKETGRPDDFYRMPRVFVTYDMTLKQFAEALRK